MQTILIGDKGVGKTFALEACIWSLCGLSDDSKSDPDMDTRTIKATAGMTTNPIPVDDGESVAKEAKLVTSAFDRTKYKTKNGTVQNVSVYMITSNIMNRLAFWRIIYPHGIINASYPSVFTHNKYSGSYNYTNCKPQVIIMMHIHVSLLITIILIVIATKTTDRTN